MNLEDKLLNLLLWIVGVVVLILCITIALHAPIIGISIAIVLAMAIRYVNKND